MQNSQATKWPKHRPTLSDKQQEVLSDWYQYWLSASGMSSGQFGRIERWGHDFVSQQFTPNVKVLEIGAGTGSHLKFEDSRAMEYYAMEHTKELSDQIPPKYPNVHIIEGDCQQTYPFPDNFVDRAIAIHVLEHLDNLPFTLKEVSRILKPDGTFSVVIPCEGGVAYSLGRMFTTKRMFEKRYKVPYEWMIRYEHINTAKEVIHELKQYYTIRSNRYFPLGLSLVDTNLVIGLTCKPRK